MSLPSFILFLRLRLITSRDGTLASGTFGLIHYSLPYTHHHYFTLIKNKYKYKNKYPD